MTKSEDLIRLYKTENEFLRKHIEKLEQKIDALELKVEISNVDSPTLDNTI